MVSHVRNQSSSRVPQSNPADNMKIMQWNARSIRSNEADLKEFLAMSKPDVLVLQSPNCTTGELPSLDGYYYPPITDLRGNQSRAYVATYIKQDKVYLAIESPAPNLQDLGSSCAVEVQSKNGKKISICNIYYPKGCKQDTTKWLTSLDQTRQWYVLGDFNAHHSLWNSRLKTDKNTQLADDITESPLCLLNDGSITRIPDIIEHSETAIDLSLASPELAISSTWHPVDNRLGSDHLPLIITLHGPALKQAEQDQTLKYNVQKANWSTFKEELNLFKKEDLFSPDIEKYYTNIRKAILEAADHSIPKKQNSSVPLFHPIHGGHMNVQDQN